MKIGIEKEELYDYLLYREEDTEELDTIYDVDDDIGEKWLRISDEYFKMLSEVGEFVEKKLCDELAKEE